MSRLCSASSASALLLAGGSLLAGGDATAQESLCMPGETIVFSCQIGPKLVSLCRPQTLQQSLIYRFGSHAGVELAVPAPGESPSPVFRLSSAPLIGGGETAVTVERGGYEYRIYSKVGRSEGTQGVPEFEDGIVVSRGGKVSRQMICDDGGAGFRESLDWLAQHR